jgi:hypothetical protein
MIFEVQDNRCRAIFCLTFAETSYFKVCYILAFDWENYMSAGRQLGLEDSEITKITNGIHQRE